MAAEKDRQIAALKEEKAALETASKQSQSQYDTLVKQLSEEVQQGQLQVRQYRNMLSVDVAEQIFFDSGRADLKDSGKQVLKKVGEALKSYDKKIIRVVGHTDNVPLAKSIQSVFPSNWELSVVRATNVVGTCRKSAFRRNAWWPRGAASTSRSLPMTPPRAGRRTGASRSC
ncbi:MAG: OmpA family protein [Chromatiales bacterium]|nr:OmpA family protein [Chromatiales bacterium]